MKAITSLCTAFAGVALSGSVALADQVTERLTTTGTLGHSALELDDRSQSAISSEPVTYKFNKTTTWVGGSGNVITSEQSRNSPVTMYYSKDGDSKTRE